MMQNAQQQSFARSHKINVSRFWSFVRRGSPDICWDWMGAKDKRGYGRFHVGMSANSAMLAHRIAFGMTTDADSAPEAVCHACDNPSCCNPDHLFGGRRLDNNRDMIMKGRAYWQTHPELHARGEAHGQSKLTWVTVADIRRAYAAGGVTQRALARQYGVCQRSISKVLRNEGWVDAAA